MNKLEQHLHNQLSLNTLENVSGGISDHQYIHVKQELDASAANNDFKSFMAIVKEYAPSGGKKFISSVLDNYTTTGFLTDNRYASLLADIISVI